MKSKLAIILFIIICFIQPTYSQPNLVINGSFEDTTLTGWRFRNCYIYHYNDAAPGGGNWCLMVPNPIEFGGCWRNYAYQVFPFIQNGDVYKLTGWCRALYPESFPIANGSIEICRKVSDPPPYDYILTIAKDTTHSLQWTFLSVQDTFILEQGDTAVIALRSNYVGTQFHEETMLFDNIELIKIDTLQSNTVKNNLPEIHTYLSNEGIHIYSDIEIEKITLTSIHGIKYYEKICRNNSHFINISYLNKGVYVLNVTDINNNITTKKITLL